MMITDGRFQILHREGNPLSTPGRRTVLADRETGVQYLFMESGYAGGLSVLVDAQGKPLLAENTPCSVNDSE